MILGAFTPQGSSVEAGTTYKRKGVGALIEVAKVLEVAPDKMGIPHVRYQLSVQRGASNPTVETRTLSIEAFLARFGKRK